MNAKKLKIIASINCAITRLDGVIRKLGIDLTLDGLVSEAEKAGSFEEFRKDFLHEIKHGLYWHLTDNPDFDINSALGPRDLSSLSNGEMTPGALMITSHLDAWNDFYNNEELTRPYAALIDMSAVPRNAYHQVNRGFGNEFFVSDPTAANVIAVMPINEALNFDAAYDAQLPSSEIELQEFYDSAIGKDSSS